MARLVIAERSEPAALARRATIVTSVAIVSMSVASAITKRVELPGQILSLHRVGWAALLYQVWVWSHRRPVTWR